MAENEVPQNVTFDQNPTPAPAPTPVPQGVTFSQTAEPDPNAAQAKAQNAQHVEDFVNPKYGTDAWYQQKLGQNLNQNVLDKTKKYVVEPFEQIAQWGHDYGSKYMERGAAEQSSHPVKSALANAVAGPFASMVMGDQSDVDKLEKEHAIVAGVARGLGGTSGAIVADPRNWPLMGLSEAMPVLDSLMKGPFAVQMTHSAWESMKNLAEHWDEMTPGQRSEEVTGAGLQTVFAEEALRHATLRKQIAQNIVDHVAKHTDIGMTSKTTSQGAEIPVQSTTLGGKLARQVTSPEITKDIAQEQTAPAVQQAVGDIAKNVTGSRVDTEINPESGDHFGLRAHAADLKAQATPSWQYIDKLSDNKFTEAQNKIDKGFADHDKDMIAEGRKEKQVLSDTFREDLKEKGLDIDVADRQYRRGSQLERIADAFKGAIDPDTGNLSGKRLSQEIGKMVNKGDKKSPFAVGDFSPEHVKSLREVADIMKDQEKAPPQFLSGLLKAGIALTGIHHLTGGLSGLAAEHFLEPHARTIGDHFLAEAMKTPSATKALPEALKTGNAQAVVSAVEKNNPGWLKKLFQGNQRGSLSWGGGVDTSDTPRTPGVRRGRISQEGLGEGLEKRSSERDADSDQTYLKTLEEKISAGGPGKDKAVSDRTKLLLRMQGIHIDESAVEARAHASKTRNMSNPRIPANPNAERGVKAPQTLEEQLAARKAQRLASQRGAVGTAIDNSDTIQKPGIRRGKTAAESADDFNVKSGKKAIEPVTPEVHPQAKEIADEYSKLKHDPSDPEVQKSYESLKNDIDAQWEHATADGFKFEPWEKEGQPYANSKEMKKDVDENKHLFFFKGGDIPTDHPLAETDPETGLTYNDKFRAIHDLYGHAAPGTEFGPKGEEAAYKTHAQMFNPESIPALTTETRGQNNWVNFGAHLRDEAGNIPKKGESGYVSPVDRPYADQKAGILPKRYHGAAPAAQGGKLQLNHWSNVDNLTETNPEHMGTGKSGREMARKGEPDFLKRTNFATEGYKEKAIQGQKHQYTASVNSSDYYDAETDPQGLWKKGYEKSGATGAEKAVRDAGYHGYQVPSRSEVASFEKVPVTKVPQTLGTVEAAKSDTANWNQAKQELGQQASFSDIAKRAQEIKDGANTRPDMSGSEIATRYPTSTKADTTNNPANTTGIDAVNQADKISPPRMTQGGKQVLGVKQKLALSLSDYMDNGLRFTGEELANPDKVINKVVGHVADNLTWLHDNMPASIRDKAKQWYDSAHDLTKKWADQYGFSHEQAAATVAALSPKNPWDNNVGQAERLMQHVSEDQNHAWTPEMDNAALKIRNSDAVNAGFGRMINDIRGKTLDELKAKTPEALLAKKAIWYRILDEAHGSKSTPVYSPDGSVRGSTTLNWGQVEPIAKALSILGNGDLQHIHDTIGQGHKIRNFYNNIINPDSERGHTTIDTHAVGAAYLKPYSQEDVEVMHNFGSGNRKGTPSPPKHAETGLKGSYPVYEEAYKQAASKLGIRPRELQSITWEGIRSLMGDSKKTPELRRAITDIWRAHESGDLTLNQAREEIVKASGGFTKPEWMDDSSWDGSKPSEEQGNASFDFGEK